MDCELDQCLYKRCQFFKCLAFDVIACSSIQKASLISMLEVMIKFNDKIYNLYSLNVMLIIRIRRGEICVG